MSPEPTLTRITERWDLSGPVVAANHQVHYISRSVDRHGRIRLSFHGRPLTSTGFPSNRVLRLSVADEERLEAMLPPMAGYFPPTHGGTT